MAASCSCGFLRVVVPGVRPAARAQSCVVRQVDTCSIATCCAVAVAVPQLHRTVSPHCTDVHWCIQPSSMPYFVPHLMMMESTYINTPVVMVIVTEISELILKRNLPNSHLSLVFYSIIYRLKSIITYLHVHKRIFFKKLAWCGSLHLMHVQV